jgi:hypothetical protein
MNITKLVSNAVNKDLFHTVENYITFCARYLEYVETGLQARIISKNENHYQFFQYRKDGHFNITRPLNSLLMYDAESFENGAKQFLETLEQIKNGEQPPDEF